MSLLPDQRLEPTRGERITTSICAPRGARAIRQSAPEVQ